MGSATTARHCGTVTGHDRSRNGQDESLTGSGVSQQPELRASYLTQSTALTVLLNILILSPSHTTFLLPLLRISPTRLFGGAALSGGGY